jgi:uncharacterized membrane protein
MKATYKNIIKYLFRLESKIAFYPTILSLLGVCLGLTMYRIEGLNFSNYVYNNAPWLLIRSVDTARTMLSTFIAGLISIMVFSFSMVMILLNQATKNYSPRILPGLISNTRHQIILGIYNSCLLYCIFTLIVVEEPSGGAYEIAGVSVLLAILFMIFSLGAFIYFIHSISQEIQINNIMATIHKKAMKRLSKLIDSEKDDVPDFPDSKDWHTINSKTSGYIEDIRLKSMAETLQEKNAKAEILVRKGEYIFENTSIVKVSEAFKDESYDTICDDFYFSKSELVEDNYLLAFKQLTEIILKAMSPSLNDPGTAINAIDYLTELLMLRMQKRDADFYFDDTDTQIISINSVSFKELLNNLMCSIRMYCKHDTILMRKVIGMLDNLLQAPKIHDKAYRSTVIEELNNLKDDINSAVENKSDLDALNLKIKEIQKNA